MLLRDLIGIGAAAGLLLLAGRVSAQEEGTAPAVDLGESGYAALVERTIAGAVRPAYGDFATRAGRLRDGVAALCAARDETHLEAARADLAAAAVGAFALLPLRLGPILEENRHERIAFWPDGRGIGLRQVQALLVDRDPAATTEEGLRGKSVAVQGLTAIEFLLDGTGAETLAVPGADGGHRCAYAEAASRNVATIAGELVAAWAPGGEGARLMTEPGPNNPMFQTHKEAAGELFGAAATGLEILTTAHLRATLGPEPGKAKPKLAPFWRSGQSVPALVAALGTIRSLVETSGAKDALRPQDAWLGGSIDFMLERAIRTASTVTLPFDQAVADPAARDALGFVTVTTQSLEGAIGRDLTAALGLEQGFNSTDGD